MITVFLELDFNNCPRVLGSFDESPWCIVSIHLYSASCSAHQSEGLQVQKTQREKSSLERTRRGTLLN